MQENAEDTSLNFLSSIQKLNLVYSCHSMYYKGYWLCIAINKVMTRFELYIYIYKFLISQLHWPLCKIPGHEYQVAKQTYSNSSIKNYQF